LSLFQVPIYTRLLSVSDYGIVSVYTTMVTIMAILTGADLHAGIGRAQIDFGDKYKEYLSSVLSLSLLLFASVFLIGYFFKGFFGRITGLPSKLFVFAMVGGYLSFIFNYFNSHLLFAQKYKTKSILNISKSLGQIILSIIFIMLLIEDKYLGRVYGSLVISLIFAAPIFWIVLFKGKKLFYKEAWKYALVIGIPLIPHNLSHILLSQFDRMAINSIVGSAEAGLYSFAYNIGMIPLVFWGAFNSAWVPWFYKQLAKKRNDYVRKVAKIYAIGFLIITISIMALGPELGLIMAPSTYQAGIRIIPVIVSSYFFQFLYTIYVNFAFYQKKTFAISIGTIATGTINVVLNLLLIPIFGYEIAAWTTVVSYFFLFIFHWANVSKFLGDKTIPLKRMLTLGCIATVIAIQQYLTSLYFQSFSVFERITRFSISGSVAMILMFYVIKIIKPLIRN